jgi:hypothetical protein
MRNEKVEDSEIEVKIKLPKSAYEFITEVISRTSGLRSEDWIRQAIQSEVASALEDPHHHWDPVWLKNRYDLQAFLDWTVPHN